jgi:methyl-accepting chemotaxis protein
MKYTYFNIPILLAILMLATGVVSLLFPQAYLSIVLGFLGILELTSLLILRKKWAVEHQRNLDDTLVLKEKIKTQEALLQQVDELGDLLVAEDTLIFQFIQQRPLTFQALPPQATVIERIRALLGYFKGDRRQALTQARELLELRTLPDSIQEVHVRFPYIDLLLKRVVEQTENAAMTLLERFSAISEQAEQGAQEAQKAMRSLGLENSDSESLENLIRQSHESIVSRSSVINEFLSLNQDNSAKIEKISNLVSKTEELISGITDISERSKLITFNLAVESAKIGVKGQGFKVIVSELQKLNDQTADFAKNILEIVKSFNTYNAQLLDQWINRSKELTEKVRSDTGQAEKTVEALARSYDLTRSLFKSLSENSIQVNQSMGDILASLQFQDITRQQIEGVNAFLSDIQGIINQLLQELSSHRIEGTKEVSTKQKIMEIYAPRLKVSKDHDIFNRVTF